MFKGLWSASLVENSLLRDVFENLDVLQLAGFTLETAVNGVTIDRV